MTPFEAITTKHKPLSTHLIEGRQVAIYSYCLITTEDGTTLKLGGTGPHTTQHIKKVFSGGFGPFINAFIDGILSNGHTTIDLNDPDSLDHLDRAITQYKLIRKIRPATPQPKNKLDKANDTAMGLYAATKKGKS